MNESKSTLERLGFQRVGRWTNLDCGPKYEVTAYQDAEGILYAFVYREAVLYIGKTVQPLRKRLYGYQNPDPSQKTNIRCNALIAKQIEAGALIEIYVLLDEGHLEYRGHKISLAAGLKDSLIAMIRPPWNKLGK